MKYVVWLLPYLMVGAAVLANAAGYVSDSAARIDDDIEWLWWGPKVELSVEVPSRCVSQVATAPWIVEALLVGTLNLPLMYAAPNRQSSMPQQASAPDFAIAHMEGNYMVGRHATCDQAHAKDRQASNHHQRPEGHQAGPS